MLVGCACRGRSCGKTPSAKELALADAGLEVLTAEQANDRVSRVFPHGVASENAHAEIGDAPAPPAIVGPEPTSSFVATIELRADSTSAAKIVAAVGPGGEAKGHWYVQAHDASTGEWVFASRAAKSARFDRIAVVVDLVDDDAKPRRALTGAELEERAAFARRLAGSIGKGEPSFSATPVEAAKRASAAVAAIAEVGDSDAMDVTIVVAPAKPGARFAGRASWDAVYSAGFVWGDGDYFHWVPSPKTDVSQGIDISSRTGTGYFFPETLEKGEAESALEDLRFT